MMDTISEKIAGLSPAKQKLLELRRQKLRSSVKQCPMSYGQKRLWFLDQLQPGHPGYNIVRALHVQGPLNAAVLKDALSELVRRHEILRTRFKMVEDALFQVVLPPSEQEVEVIDLSAMAPEDRKAHCTAIVDAEARRCFDLNQTPLFVAVLARLADDDHLLVLNTHHIISDGWSTAVMIRELTTLYAACAQGRKPSLPKLPVQYRDYARWQQEWLQSSWLGRQLNYWKEQLAGSTPLIELPRGPFGSTDPHRAGAAQLFTLEPSLAVALRDLSRNSDATLFMLLMTAFSALLSRYTGQSCINMGTPIAGRNKVELESLIGFFTNTLVIRSDLSGDPSFAALLQQVRSTVLEAHANQDVPFEMVVEALHPDRELDQNPLFQVMFVFQNMPHAEIRLPDLVATAFPVQQRTAKFDLTLTMMEQGAVIESSMQYRDGLFGEAAIRRMIGHFRVMLTDIIRDPHQRVSALPLLTHEERHQLLFDWNRVELDVSLPICAHQMFEKQTVRTPSSPALVHDGQSLTYAELNRRANQLAHYLQERGVGLEAQVGIYLDRGLEMMVALLGILKAGAAYVPLEPSWPRHRINLMIEQVGIKACVTQWKFADRLSMPGNQVVCLDRDMDEISARTEENPQTSLLPENLAYVLYTAGSTGWPKAVAIEHRQLRNYISGILQRIDFSSATNFALLQPLSVDACLTTIFPPLCTGGCVHVVASERALDPAAMAEHFHRTGIDYLKLAPSHLAALHNSPESEQALRPSRLLILGGEPFPWERAKRLKKVLPGSCALYNQYGPTETTVAVLTYRVESPLEQQYALTPLGRPLPNSKIYILDKAGEPVPIGVRGEIYIAGQGLARGYMKRPEWTAERFLPCPFGDDPGARMYRTGDLARYLEDGNVEFLGRTDEQTKIRGYRVECAEVELALTQYPAVAQAVVSSREDQRGDRRLVAYVAARENGQVGGLELRDHLRKHLPEYMVPSVFMFLEALPLTPHGKVDRQGLPEPTPELLPTGSGYLAPRTQSERQVAAIFGELLGIEKVGVHDNFFALGGHSLLATQVTARVRSRLNIELPLRVLFEEPTVDGVAKRIEQERNKGTSVEIPALVKESRRGPLPLSYAQQRLWFIDQMNPGSAAYNMPFGLRLRGELDREAMRRSMLEVVQRHEVLRTRFSQQDGIAVQEIAEGVELEIQEIDLRHLPSELREQEATSLAAREAGTPFDLSQGPLLRVTLLQLDEQDHVLLLTLHHIVSDGWSMEILEQEFAALYKAYRAGMPTPLADLEIQYGDYSVWQRKWLEGEVLHRQMEYWRRQLAGVAALVLPTSKTRSRLGSQVGAVLDWELGKELTGRLKDICQAEGTTLFMTLLAGWQLLLARYSGQADVVVGTPVVGRRWKEMEALIGFFVNTLVLRVQVNGEQTFRDLLGSVRETTLGAYEHQDVPFEKLVEELQPERDLSRPPLFQVMFVFQNLPQARFELPGLKVSRHSVFSATEKFELTLTAVEEKEKISGKLSYRTELFSQSVMRRLLHHFENLLTEIVSHPEKRMDDLPLLGAAERRHVLTSWNRTEARYPQRTIHAIFEDQVRKTPDAIALEDQATVWTYRELNRRANQLGHGLRKLGVAPETMVAVCAERGFECVISLLAILKAGGVYVPLEPAYPPERLRQMVEDCAPAVVLTQDHLLGLFKEMRGEMPVFDLHMDAWRDEAETNLEHIGLIPDHAAYMIYTSGSTGTPKGVVVSHRALVNKIWTLNQYLEVSPSTRYGALSSFSFDPIMEQIFCPLCAGGTSVIVPEDARHDTKKFVEQLSSHPISVLNASPAFMEHLLLAQHSALCIDALIIGSDVLPPSLVNKLHEARITKRLFNFYGPTETCVDATAYEVPVRPAAGPIPIGAPLPNYRVYVLSPNLEPVPVGVAGVIYVGGEGVARGYLNRPELTAEKFVPDPFSGKPGERLYRTGDLGRWSESGAIEFIGRDDAQVKIRGFRIELGEIEAHLREYPGIREAVAIANHDAPHGKRILAYVTNGRNNGATLQAGAIRRFLQQRLPEYMIPAAVIVLQDLPLTPTGKVDRKILADPKWAPNGEKYDDDGSRTIEEELLCEVWKEVLKKDRVGVRSNFFEMGGHSLLATQLMSRIMQTFSVKLPLRTLFESPTVAELAEVLAKERTHGEFRSHALTSVTRENPLPLSFGQQRLWFLHQLEPHSAAYNMPMSLRLKGALNLEALQASFDVLMLWHEVFRTRFVLKDGEPIQLVAPEPKLHIEHIDGREWPREERNAIAASIARSEATMPFDLQRGPLLRIKLLQLEQHEYLLVINLHHIICDAWSFGIIVRQLASLYEAHVNGEVIKTPAPTVQYGDFAVWQKKWLQGKISDHQIAYWRKTLEGAPVLDMPTRQPRQDVSDAGASKKWVLPEELAREVRRIGHGERATLFMTLLASIQVVLSRYSGQSDISTGVPIAGRTHKELEELVGFFANTLVMRTNIDGRLGFAATLRRVREIALEAYAHQDVPFEKIVEELAPERDLVRTPLFQVMFILQNVPHTVLKLPGLTLSRERLSSETEKFDITLVATEEDGTICGEISYRRCLFDEPLIERFLGHWQTLLRGMLQNIQQPVGELDLLTEPERWQILTGWNEADSVSEAGCLHELFHELAGKIPEAVALEHEDQTMSYGELDCRSNQLAHYLRSLGAGPEVVVALCVQRSLDMVVGLLGILKSGAAYLPLDPDHPKARLRYTIEDARASLVLTQSVLQQELPEIGAAVVCLDSDWQSIARWTENLPRSESCPANLAYVIHTSGSTGKPKGVMITHGSLINILLAVNDKIQMRQHDRLLATTTISFDIAALELFAPLIAGARVVIAPPSKTAIEEIALRIQRGDITIMQATPTLWTALLEEARIPAMDRLKILCGGEALDQATGQRLLRTSTNVWNIYGPTETTVWSAMQALTGTMSTIAPIGRPLWRTQVYIVNGEMAPAPIGVSGELYIGGAGLARGYCGRPDLTAERFVPNPFRMQGGGERLYRTGDLARRLSDGTIEFIGRVDHQIKLRGFRIELPEIEGLLNAHESVEQSVVLLREDQRGDKRLVGYVTKKIHKKTDSQAQPLQVAHWQHLWQQLYETDLPSSGPDDFNLAGWRSSYTGAAIDKGDMRLWVEETVSRLRAFRATDVLEIGCGTGLLLTRLAQSCGSYVGIDFSEQALMHLKNYKHKHTGMSHITLRRGAAHELTFIADSSVDLVIINSVVQYFPNVDYLLQVLWEAVRILRLDGRIFIGDVRSLALLEVYHAAVQTYRASGDLTLGDLRLRVTQAMQDEKELLVDPAFFKDLAARWPKVGRVDFWPKLETYNNELSQFRYDVVLTMGPKETILEPDRWLNWDTAGECHLAIKRALLDRPGSSIGLKEIRDDRISSAVEIVDLLKKDNTLLNADQLRKVSHQAEGQNIQELNRFATELGAELSWRPVNATGRYNLIFNPVWQNNDRLLNAAPASFYRQFANEPTQAENVTLAHTLQNYLKESLPDYMIPSAIMVLSRWPLTSSGKVDRRSLPAPERRSARLYRAPTTAEEQVLCDVFAQVLNCERVGVEDDFFVLGGHSLMAVHLLAEIERRTMKKLPLSELFRHPTVGQLAALLRENQASLPLITVEMKKGVLSLPLFFVHGAGGSAFSFNQLARHLSPEISFFVFQDPGVERSSMGASSIPSMAAEYIAAMHALQPKGPYLLGGWSLGGLVAHEMARQLRERTETIGLLVLIDSYPAVTRLKGSEDDGQVFKSFLSTCGFSSNDLKRIADRPVPLEEMMRRAQYIGTDCGVFPSGISMDVLQHLFQVYRRHAIAGTNFKPQPVDVSTHLWSANETLKSGIQQRAAWEPYVSVLHIHELPGDHFTLLREPYVGVLAAQLSRHVQEANTKLMIGTSVTGT